MDVWPTISAGNPSPRTEVVYNIAEDPSESRNVAAGHSGVVAALQKRANELGAELAKPLLLETEVKAMLERIKLPPSLPSDLQRLNAEP